MDHEYLGVKGKISLFPEFCRSLGMSHAVYIHPLNRGKGLGTKAHADRIEKAKLEGFRYLICSVRNNNKAQLKILRKFGWKELTEFNTYCYSVTLYGLNLYPNEPIKFPKEIM